MEDDNKVLDLVQELVHRLLNTYSPISDPHLSSNSNPSSVTSNSIHTNHQQALKYAIRILFARMTPSIAADEAAMAESIKRQLATQGKSSDALPFADLYSKFASKVGPGSVNNKWSVMYLLKVLSDDRKSRKMQPDSRISTGFYNMTIEIVGEFVFNSRCTSSWTRSRTLLSSSIRIFKF